MKHIVLSCLLLFVALHCYGQDPFAEYEKFKQQARQSYNDFRKKCNEEYAEFMRKPWIETEPSPVIPKPKDDTVPPVVTPKEDIPPVSPEPQPIPYDEVIPAPQPQPQPQPVEPIKEIPVTPVAPVQPTVSFIFFGTEDKVRFDKKYTIRLSALNENAIADAWLKLSEESFTNLVHDCLNIREKYDLCDWAYLMMLQKMSEAICGKGTNEAMLLMAYVYCQSGYQMRLAFGKDKLYMMFASQHVIFNWNYYIIDGVYYYMFGNAADDVRICLQSYPKEKSMSLVIGKEQKFALISTDSSSHQSTRNSEMAVTMTANKNMLDFYSTYPTSKIGTNVVTRWAMYANTPMPDNVKKQVYPQLIQAIGDTDQLSAVNKILNWVQTGFEYGYDDKVWGYDRAFFPEESLHYPYCDCEDRSILLTRIVRDVLGLKCILIFYPGHLAAAVEITEGNPTGDYIEYGGHRFFIADGTIIGYGAPVGATMRGMDNATAKIILLE